MEYIKSRKADPVEVADAIWLFSLVMCGNSPANVTIQTGAEKKAAEEKEKGRRSKKKKKEKPASLFDHVGLDIDLDWQHEKWIEHHGRKALEQTCFVCPLQKTCDFGIPTRQYYDRGLIIIRPRLKLEETIDPRLIREPRPQEVIIDQDVLQLLHIGETGARLNAAAGFLFCLSKKLRCRYYGHNQLYLLRLAA